MSNPPDSPADAGERRAAIPIMIAAASLLFLAAAAVLYYRWVTMNEPRCVVVVEAGPALKGAEISVDGTMLLKPLKMTVGENGRYVIPFFLDAGDYTVTVKMDGEVQQQLPVTLTNANRGWKIDLSKFKPTTTPAPATSPSGGI